MLHSHQLQVSLDAYSQEIQEHKRRYKEQYSQEDKQDYWNKWFSARWWHHEYEDFPIPFSAFQKKHEKLEKNIHSFMP